VKVKQVKKEIIDCISVVKVNQVEEVSKFVSVGVDL
jgi:hypothetical protein